MSDSTTDLSTRNQIAGLRRMLAQTAEIAEQSSLTGSFEKGAAIAVQQYNAAVQLLEKLGAVPAGFFAVLPDGSGFDVIGVASAQISSFLEQDDDEKHRPSHHGPKFIIENNNHSRFTPEEQAQLRELLNRRMQE